MKIWIRDKLYNEIHRVGQDLHDSLWVDYEGTLHYSNLQNGDGCGEKSVLDEGAGYEFCPMMYGQIDKDYLMNNKPEIWPEEEGPKEDKDVKFLKGFTDHLLAELTKKRIPNETEEDRNDNIQFRDGWVSCKERLPERGKNVILFFRDTYHTHHSWPKTTVASAWRANVGEEDTPDGVWKIEGRLWDCCIDIEDGIAWMPMPDAPQGE